MQSPMARFTKNRDPHLLCTRRALKDFKSLALGASTASAKGSGQGKMGCVSSGRRLLVSVRWHASVLCCNRNIKKQRLKGVRQRRRRQERRAATGDSGTQQSGSPACSNSCSPEEAPRRREGAGCPTIPIRCLVALDGPLAWACPSGEGAELARPLHQRRPRSDPQSSGPCLP